MPNRLNTSIPGVAIARITQTINAAGSPQKSADNPRTNRPSDRSSSALGGVPVNRVSGVTTCKALPALAASAFSSWSSCW